MNTIEKLQDPQLYGGLPAFQDLTSWWRWRVFLKVVEGLPLDEAELAVFQYHTGRLIYHPPYPELVCIVGVQSGKSTICGILLDEAALTGAPGTYAIGIAQDIRGSMRTLLKYAREPFETLPLFQQEVARDTQDLLALRRGTFLAAYPCRQAAVRGVMANRMVLDEAGFYVSTDGRPMDLEMMRVARGRVAMTNGQIIVISSPYAQSGLLWDLHQKHFGVNESPTLVWQGAANEMNPLLSADYLARMEQDDPEAYRSEVLGEFRSGVTTLFDPEMIAACVDPGVRERMPQARLSSRKKGGFDIAGGRGDAAVAAVADVGLNGRAVLCAIRIWRSPFDPAQVIAEAAAFYKSWGVYEPSGDAYAAEFVPEQFRRHGLTYKPLPWTRSELYLELLPLVNSQSVVLLDHPELLKELRGLERRRGAGGRDKCDHRRGFHDDIANASAIALTLCTQKQAMVRVVKLSGI